ncbi:MAG: carboxypeptidase-like regulatory domain-containing protein [Candidatus Marinimicrobia bacterium]|nr:carboxypeptidase-like regulatory domain-containing protein [Candidatus Neomarinimicrobiota bacterium]
MKKILKRILFLSLLTTNLFASQYISGYVKDRDTKEPLSYTNISIVGSELGTISNRDGRFVINIDEVKNYKLLFSYIGYKNKTIGIKINSDSLYNRVFVYLAPEPIKMKEVTVTPGHNPANDIIKKVYEKLHKKRKDYYYAKAFYRQYSSYDDSKYVDAREMFYKLSLNLNKIDDWRVSQGRHAKIIFQKGGGIPYMKNLSLITRAFKFISSGKIRPHKIMHYPIERKPGKHYRYRIKGYKTQNKKNVVIISLSPSKREKGKGTACTGEMEILLDSYEILRFTATIYNPDKLKTKPDYKNIYVVKETIRWNIVNKIINNKILNYIVEVEDIVVLGQKKDNNKKLEVSNYSVMLFYDYTRKDLFADKKTMTGKENDVKIVEELDYDPDFWKKNAKIISEIPIEKDIINYFKKYDFYGNMFPGGLKLEERKK